jgi:MFS family permease
VKPTPTLVATAGLLALAVAMGVGRFAFTPILPMMQAETGLTLAAAGWLAAANYLGYLVGALGAARLSTTWAVRGGLVLIALATFGMGITHVFAAQLALRLVAGIASAWVLVHVSAWALAWLSALKRTEASGVVFAGVGAGIAGAGLLCMLMMQAGIDADRTWQVFGVVSLVLVVSIWPAFGRQSQAANAVSVPSTPPRRRWQADQRRLIICYGAYGFGYIIPATFLPAMAHAYISNPVVFGWAWPVFGAAAALSTWGVSRWLHATNIRRLWAACYLLMAAGVVLPVIWPSLVAILSAALLVGGTFMVVTMLGLREGRRIAGADATAFMAALTAAFAVTQVLGPLVVSAVAGVAHGLAAALTLAALVLVWAAAILWRSAR